MIKSHKNILLTGLILGLFAFGCSQDTAVKMRYQAEKMYFLAEAATRAAQVNPRQNEFDGYRQLGDHYRKTLNYCYASLDSIDATQNARAHSDLSVIAFKAASRLSQLAFAAKQYDSTAHYSEQLLKRVELRGEARISAYLNLGEALQAAGRWDSALTVYEYSIDNFFPPLDTRGQPISNLLNLPAHIYEVYTRIGDTLTAAVAFDRAEAYYNGLITGFPTKPRLAQIGHARLAGLNNMVGNADEAIRHLRQIVDSTGQTASPARLQMADIWAEQPGKRQDAVAEYDHLLNELTPADSMMRPSLLYKKSIALLELKKYSEARAILNGLEANHRAFFANTPNAQYAIARSFELEGNWERAEQEYQFVIKNYPGSEQGMATYLYLAEKYAEQGRTKEAGRIESEAQREYERLAAERAGTPLESVALNYKAELLRRKKDWPAAADILISIFEKQPESELGHRSMLTAAVIYRDKLGNRAKADSLIEVLKTQLIPADVSQGNQEL